MHMKIKQGDTVYITTGKDRGKTGTVLRAFPKKEQVVVEGVGVVKKHRRGRRVGQAGQIVEHPTPVHVSNVALKDPKTGKASRVGYVTKDGKKVRVSKKSGTAL